MKFSITPDAFQDVLAQTVAAVPTRTTTPILTNVLIEADESGLLVSGTDLNIGLRVRVPAQVTEAGQLAVPAKKLLELARLLPNETVSVETSGQSVKLSCGKSNFNLNGLPADEFPTFPEIDFEKGWGVPGDMIGEMVDRVKYAASSEEARPTLNGVLWELKADGMAMVATDGHRLARYMQPSDHGPAAEMDLIVPPKALDQVKKLFTDGETVQVSHSDNYIAFQRQDTLVYARLIEGPYPNYDRVIPKDNDKVAVIDNDALQSVLRRMSVVASEQTHRVRMAFAGDTIRFSVETPDVGDAKEEIEVSYDGEPLEIGFNARYLIEVLKAVPSDTIKMTFKAAERAALVSPVVDGDAEAPDYVALVMPLRLNV